MKKLLIALTLLTTVSSSASGLSVFTETSLKENILSLDMVTEANTILSSLSQNHIKRLAEAFEGSKVVTLYRCKVFSLQLAIGGAGGICTGIEIRDNGNVRVKEYVKIAIQAGPGIEVNQIEDIEVYANYLSEYSGQVDVFSNGAAVLGVGIKHINADTKESNEQSFYDGHLIRGLSFTWVSAQVGITIPTEKTIELRLEKAVIKRLFD